VQLSSHDFFTAKMVKKFFCHCGASDPLEANTLAPSPNGLLVTYSQPSRSVVIIPSDESVKWSGMRRYAPDQRALSAK